MKRSILMHKLTLNLGTSGIADWQMRQLDTECWHAACVPGSVYADLMADGSMPDPFWRDNELAALELMKQDWEYLAAFDLPANALNFAHIELRCEGLDTLADVFLNGEPIGHADNMHITWAWNVKERLREGRNELRIIFRSPINFCAAAAERAPGWESSDGTTGFRHLRKAHCMFGWDWGPRLPDAGVWRPIHLICWNEARVEDVLIRQIHADGRVTLRITPETEGESAWQAIVTAPDGQVWTTPVLRSESADVTIDNPQLWWPRGFGRQPLYRVEVRLISGGSVIDRWTRRIGLRTMSVSREKDQWGEEFCHIVNGVKVFAMGADYIPEDNLLCRVTPERTRRLLEDAALAHFNTVRIWGGGYYPDDFFFDICDELGLMVWQDLMYACAFYDLTAEFEASIRLETEQNVKRLRHHPSLALICGNNEMEQFMSDTNDALVHRDPHAFYPKNRRHVSDYIKMFEYILPAIVKQHAPDTFWWPGSPSSGGDFDAPNDYNRGDVHYWDVWHGEKPFTEYRKFHFRYASEFGFQSFPCLKTVESFTLPQDRNIFSRIMERHQRNGAANGKIMAYLAQTFRYPGSFDDLLYASQLLQAEAMRCGVEHWRRHRGRCMGAIIWQLNDIWPVASWSSIDYFGRWKALHYAARRFFAPVMISCEEHGELDQNPRINEYRTAPIERSIRLNVANETREDVHGTVIWSLRTAAGAIVREERESVTIPALSSLWLDKVDLTAQASVTGHYVSYAFLADSHVVSEGTAIFCAPKHFDFAAPNITAHLEDGVITLHADAYARQVWIESDDPDLLLSDNAFDMNPGEKHVTVLRGNAEGLRVRSVYDIGR